MRRFPQPWTVEQIPGGYKVIDANGQSLAYVYGRETKADADIANVLTMDEARRIASISPSRQSYFVIDASNQSPQQAGAPTPFITSSPSFGM